MRSRDEFCICSVGKGENLDTAIIGFLCVFFPTTVFVGVKNQKSHQRHELEGLYFYLYYYPPSTTLARVSLLESEEIPQTGHLVLH